jgi:hypothetical protein
MHLHLGALDRVFETRSVASLHCPSPTVPTIPRLLSAAHRLWVRLIDVPTSQIQDTWVQEIFSSLPGICARELGA